MGKKSKKVTQQKTKGGTTANDEAFRRFVGSVQVRPSTTHGEGLFATRRISKGVYRTSNPELLLRQFLMTFTNSVSMPPWRKIFQPVLLLDDDGTTEGGAFVADSFDAVDASKRQWLEEIWLNYVEQGQPNISYSMYTVRGNFGVAFTVHETVHSGEELLRNYGHEWLVMKHFALLESWEKLQPFAKKDNTFACCVDMKTLELVVCKGSREDFLWSQAATPTLRDEDFLPVELPEILFIVDCLKFLADTFGRNDPHLENHWNIGRLQHEEKYPNSSAPGRRGLTTMSSVVESFIQSLG